MNSLRFLPEFTQVLSDYHLSAEGIEILADTKLLLLMAPTSSGRNTLIHELVATGEYYYIVSDTTRKPRTNNGVPEQSGVEYWFRPEEEILEDLRAGLFLEAAIIHNQQVSGISIRELKKAKQEDKIAVTDVEIKGVENIRKGKPDAMIVFLLPPSFEEWQRRLQARGAMDKAELRRRMESAVQEFQHALTHDYYTLVVNDTLKHAVAQVHTLTTTGSIESHDEEANRALAEELLEQTREYLQQLQKGS